MGLLTIFDCSSLLCVAPTWCSFILFPNSWTEWENERKQQHNIGRGLCYVSSRPIWSLVKGFWGIFESTNWCEKASSYLRKHIKQKNRWVNISGCISFYIILQLLWSHLRYKYRSLESWRKMSEEFDTLRIKRQCRVQGPCCMSVKINRENVYDMAYTHIWTNVFCQ